MKEEILTRLKEMLSNLKIDKVTSITAENRDSELKKINSQRELLEFQAKELELKLSNNENYQDFSYMKNQLKIYDYKTRISQIDEEIATNEASKKRNNARIKYINREIDSNNALLSEAKNYLEQGERIRQTGDVSNVEAGIWTKISSSREDILKIETELQRLNSELNDLNESKEQLNRRSKTLSNSKERYLKLLESVQERENNAKNNIDKAKKQEDERKLLQIQASIEAFNNREEYISFDFPLELESLIEDMENNKIDDVEALTRLKELKAKMPDPIANKDYSNVQKEIEENDKLQAEILMEKTDLEEKLSDSNNYLPSMFLIEGMASEIGDLESNIAKYDSDIQAEEANIIRYENSEKHYDTQIQNAQDELSKLEQQLSDILLKELVLPRDVYEQQKDSFEKERKRIKEKRDAIDAKIKQLSKFSVSCHDRCVAAKNYKRKLEKLKSDETKLLESKKNELSEKAGVNETLMNKDKLRLQTLNSQLTMLKFRENNLLYDYEDSLDKIIAGFKLDDKKSNDDVILPMDNDSLTNLEVPTKDSILVNSTDSRDENQELVADKQEKGFVLVDNNDTANNQPEEQEEKGLSVVPPTVNPFVPPKIDNEPTKIKAWLGKAKNKVYEKLKDKEFRKKVAAGVGAAILSLTLSLGLSKCSSQSEMYNGNSIVSTIDDDIGNDHSPEETPEQTPEEKPEETPEQTPEEKPEETPEQTPEEKPEETPEQTPEENPEETPEQTPEENPEETPEQTPEENPEPEDKETQVVESGQVGILQTDDDTVTVTDNVDLTTGEENTPQQQVAQEIIDRLEQEGNEIGTSLDDPNVDSSTVSDDGTITNTYEDNTTPGDKTVEDVIEEIANENHDGEVSDDIWNDLNDLYLEEIGENSEEIGGKSR